MHVGPLRLDALSDGTFVARPTYFAAGASRPDVFDRDGAAWLPIGCFLVRTGDRVVLVDAGLGPELQRLPDDMHLVGGQLPTGLRALGVSRDEVTDVVCTHLHADHVGWLFDQRADPFFPAAAIWFGAADRHHFVDGPGEMAEHIAAGFRRADPSRLRPVEQDTAVAPGVGLLMTPGHTPGHLSVVVESPRAAAPQRVLLLGDAITCPVQLQEPGWHSMADVDPDLAARTRDRAWRLLADERTIGVGAHFPELQPGRVDTGGARRWVGWENGGDEARGRSSASEPVTPVR